MPATLRSCDSAPSASATSRSRAKTPPTETFLAQSCLSARCRRAHQDGFPTEVCHQIRPWPKRRGLGTRRGLPAVALPQPRLGGGAAVIDSAGVSFSAASPRSPASRKTDSTSPCSTSNACAIARRSSRLAMPNSRSTNLGTRRPCIRYVTWAASSGVTLAYSSARISIMALRPETSSIRSKTSANSRIVIRPYSVSGSCGRLARTQSWTSRMPSNAW